MHVNRIPAAKEGLGPGQHLYGREDLRPAFQEMYEGYIREPKQERYRDGWRTAYLALAYLGGHYEVAREQLEQLHWKPAQRNLMGWRMDLSLLAPEVAARTGPAAAEIQQAEANYAEGDVTKASGGFQTGLVVGIPSDNFYDWSGFCLRHNDTEGSVVSLAKGWYRSKLAQPVEIQNGHNAFHFVLRDGKVTASVNGKEAFSEQALPSGVAAGSNGLRLGIGGYHDSNETVIRYTRLEARKL